MTQAQEAITPEVAPITAAAVAQYLRQHPDFFLEHGDLLRELKIPHESGRAVSLLERQVAVYRQRQYAMDEQFNDIVGNAKINDALFEKTRLVILDLLRCRTLAQLLGTIGERIRGNFDASAATLAFVTERGDAGALLTIPPTALRTAFGEFHEKQRTWCGSLNPVQQSLLFPKQSAPIVSAAVVPLHLSETSRFRHTYGQPLLLIGSTQASHFNSTLDTLFLDFIGEVLSVHLLSVEG
ncbi:MAG: DUF484 family protein [Pseudomonadales bacterium]|jgi:uncharacterized protein YigA (DUF484 family)|nr:DUF484 family protein [Pseudomonadales bacterium]